MKKNIAKKEKKIATNKKYIVTVVFNDTQLTTETDNLTNAFYDLPHASIKTHFSYTITNTENSTMAAGFLLLGSVRRIFRSKIGVDVFINRLIFK